MRRRNRNGIERVDRYPTLCALVDFACALLVYSQCDAMVGERKDRGMDCTVGCRSCLERRQNPHAVPSLGGLLKQNLVFLKNEGVIFDEFFCPGSASFGRQRFRLDGAAEFFYRTNAAFRLSRQTNERAEIDEC